VSVALTCSAVFLACVAAASFLFFVVARRHAVALWLLINTCSPLSLLFVLLYAAGQLTAACFASGMVFFYGAGGLLFFGWPRRRVVLIPQVIHAAMVCSAILLLAQAHEPRHWIARLAGLACSFPVFYVLRHALSGRADVAALLQDPVVGPAFARLLGKRE